MVYVTGDMHGDYDRFKARALRRLRRGDTLIICGDFGFVWDGGKAEQRLLKKLGRKRYTIAFLDGVHENHGLLAGYGTVDWNGGRARQISGRLYQLLRGQVYTIEGNTVFTLGGGENPDADCWSEALEGCMPTAGELEQAERNLAAADYRVDYVVTHECTGVVKSFLNMDSNMYNQLYAFLNRAAQTVRCKRWFFGCQHIDKVIPPKYVGVYKEVRKLE
ncbi:metallophosphoesterase [Clostridiaceae bacterium NSJ-31]|uniref:Metallophosphoesterase n=1 Tax=Ligaoa zhengdingensis TaxID=2763658 RepID=A0A926I5K0_9FIRM|nr:metallophosphoesterase [Ligaoa zhengdingensis]MBC8547550.1 metallophosphoesterase [Ligaoa zhengdingensis]